MTVTAAIIALWLLLTPIAAFAVDIPLLLVPGPTVGGTLTFSASLSGLGLSEVGSITVTDDGTPVGGASGIFSGFDLDALFLDVDGDILTAGDRFFGTSFVFSAGSTRPTGNPGLLPTAAHPGPTFGSLDANTVDVATATLDLLDGVNIADVDVAGGELTLGDGGVLTANFVPGIPVGATLFLALGEVGGQPGEGLSAIVTVSDVPRVPEPSTLVLLASGLAGVAALQQRRRSRQTRRRDAGSSRERSRR